MIQPVVMGTIAVVASVVGMLVWLFVREALNERFSTAHSWLESYKGLVTRYGILSLFMFGACGFCFVSAATGRSSDASTFQIFGFVSGSAGLWFLWQIRQILRNATLEGRRRRRF